MPHEVVIGLFIAWFILFLVAGQTVCTVLWGAGLIGIVLWTGPATIISFMQADVYWKAATYSLITVPLFILMAQFLMIGDLVKDVYALVYKLSGQRRYPLGALTMVFGGFLGAVSGAATAIASAMALIASPLLRSYGYSKDFSISIAAAAGSLSEIVPPAIILIVYGCLVEIPIGRLFAGAIIPGVLATLSLMLVLYLMGRKMKGTTAPPQVTATELAKVRVSSSLVSIIVLVVIMGVIFGGIFSGTITATEAGGIASFVAFIAIAAMRRLTWPKLKDALLTTVNITALVMIIVFGAQFFGRFMSLSMIPRQLVLLLDPIMHQPYLVLFLLLLIFFILGMILESVAAMIMALPVIIPIVNVLGLDPLWFGVLACYTIAVGLITPPVGLAVYAAAGAAKVPVEEVFRYDLVFAVATMVIVMPLLVIFPELVTFLPSLMR